MPLERQNIVIPLSGGLMQGVDERLVPPGSLLEADNLNPDKEGRLTKRYGVAATTTTGLDLTEGPMITMRGRQGDSVLCMTGNGIQRLSDQWRHLDGDDRWRPGEIIEHRQWFHGLADEGQYSQRPTLAMAYSSAEDKLLVAWYYETANPHTLAGVWDRTNQVWTIAPEALTQCYEPKAAFVNGRFYLIGHNDTGTDLRGFSIDDAATSFPAVGDYRTNMAAGGVFDIAVNDTDDYVGVVYYNTSSEAELVEIDGTGATARGTSAFDISGGVALTYHADLALYVMAYADATPTTAEVRTLSAAGTFSAALSFKTGMTSCTWVGVVYRTATTFMCFALDGANLHMQSATSAHASAPTTTGTAQTFYNETPGRPFYHNSEVWLPLEMQEDGADGTQLAGVALVVVDEALNRLVPMGTIGVVGGGYPGDSIQVSSNDDRLYMPYIGISSSRHEDASFITVHTARWAVIDVDGTGWLPSAQVGDNVYVGGMKLSYTDGVETAENAPLRAPTITASGLSGSTYSYSWVAHFEWEDQNGYLHRGPVSVATTDTSTTAVGTATATITAKTYSAHGIEDVDEITSLRIALYRTESNGTVYHRVGEVSCSDGAATRTFSDNMSDSTLVKQPTLYTTGGILEAQNPPAPSAMLYHNGRLWLVPAEEPNTVWYSKPLQPTEKIAPEFHPVLAHAVFGDGKITALSSVGDVMLVFTASSVYALTGDGGNAAGAGSTLSEPRLVTSLAGASSGALVARTPVGVMFAGAAGVWLIDASLQPKHIGKDIEDHATSTMSCILPVPEEKQVRIGKNTSITWLVYHYEAGGLWTTHTVAGSSVLHATSLNGTPYWLNQAGTPRNDDTGYFDPSSTYVVGKVTTPWIKLSGLAGFQRVRRAVVTYEAMASHDLRVRIGYDYSSSWTDTFTFDTAAVGDSGIEQVLVHPSRQKCQAIRFEITDQEDTPGTGQGIRPMTIELQVGLKSGLKRVPSGKRA